MEEKRKNSRMYEFISHTWNPVKGKCSHNCSYCYMGKWPQRELRLDNKELNKNLEQGNSVFIGSGTDLFAANVPSEWIARTLDYADKFDNKYLLQSKNPERILEFSEHPIIKKSVVCTTIETNRYYKDIMHNSPIIEARVAAMEKIASLGIATIVTCEPIIDFDINEMVHLIERCKPRLVTIGKNSRDDLHLPEPSDGKLIELISIIGNYTRRVYLKKMK